METKSKSEETMQMPWWGDLVQGILSIIIGLLLLTYPAATITVLVQFLGIYWLVTGIFSIISIFMNSSMWGWNLFGGILGIVAGLSILQHPLWSSFLLPSFLVIFLGLDGLAIGVISLLTAIKSGNWAAGILGGLSILIGLLLLGSPLIAIFSLPYIYGVLCLIAGISAIFASFRRRKQTKNRGFHV